MLHACTKKRCRKSFSRLMRQRSWYPHGSPIALAVGGENSVITCAPAPVARRWACVSAGGYLGFSLEMPRGTQKEYGRVSEVGRGQYRGQDLHAGAPGTRVAALGDSALHLLQAQRSE